MLWPILPLTLHSRCANTENFDEYMPMVGMPAIFNNQAEEHTGENDVTTT